MLYQEVTAVCSEKHIKHRHPTCGKKAELLNVNEIITGL